MRKIYIIWDSKSKSYCGVDEDNLKKELKRKNTELISGPYDEDDSEWISEIDRLSYECGH